MDVNSTAKRRPWALKWPRRYRPGPLVQMTMALVSLCGMLLLLADVLLGVFPDRVQEQQRARLGVSEALAVQVAALLQASEPRALQATLGDAARLMPGVRSAGLRRADGVLVMETPEHRAAWATGETSGAEDVDRIKVSMMADGKRWGQLEVSFQPLYSVWWKRWTNDPMLLTLSFMGVMGSLVIGLYMRRALQQLDPSQVIPERVQSAFDAMSEGVVVLDKNGRMLLCNRAFRSLCPLDGQLKTGQALAQLRWLVAGLGPQHETYAWIQAMNSRTPVAGQTVEVQAAEASAAHAPAGVSAATMAAAQATQQLVINAAPILDGNGRVRGCLVTFSDMTRLHRTNLALVQTLGERDLAHAEIAKKNEELHRLATRDPMTGCYNRRAFTESFESMFKSASAASLPLNCLVLDIDFFKKVNDTHGHTIGDRVIQEVARLLQGNTRPSDLVCRYGGEEFVVVLPGLDFSEARAVAERIREAIQQECGPSVKEVPGMKVTMSIGLAALAQGAQTPAELIDHADHALYVAKKTGRNRVCQHGDKVDLPVQETADAVR